jgi:cytochrome c553
MSMKPPARFVGCAGALIGLLASGAAVVGCSSNDGVGQGRDYLGGEAGVASCPAVNAKCSGSGPSYATDVAPILAAHCTGCHGPGGENADVPLDTFNGATSPKVKIISASLVSACKMPPPPLPSLSADDIATLRCWYAQLHPAK